MCPDETHYDFHLYAVHVFSMETQLSQLSFNPFKNLQVSTLINKCPSAQWIVTCLIKAPRMNNLPVLSLLPCSLQLKLVREAVVRKVTSTASDINSNWKTTFWIGSKCRLEPSTSYYGQELCIISTFKSRCTNYEQP